MSCKCDGHYTDRWHRWRVLERQPGGSKSSRLYCLDCRWEWRSRAKYVVLLPDHQKRVRSGLRDVDVLEAIIHRKLYRVDVNTATVYGRDGKPLTVITRTHKDGPQRGTYRFINFSIDGRQKKVTLHRLVWMVANGRTVPDGHDVDHVHNQDDDSIGNLRLLTSYDNQTRPHRKESGSGAF